MNAVKGVEVVECTRKVTLHSSSTLFPVPALSFYDCVTIPTVSLSSKRNNNYFTAGKISTSYTGITKELEIIELTKLIFKGLSLSFSLQS